MGPASHQPEVLVQWVGLDPFESSWEVAAELFKDVPVLLKRFVTQLVPSPLQERLLSLFDDTTAKSVSSKEKSKRVTGIDKKGKSRLNK
jgi:hypothetical protein